MPPSLSAGLALQRVTIVCPGFAEAFARESQRMPSLERLAAYAGTVERPHSHGVLDAWQRELLDALELDASMHPSAPLTWLGVTGERGAGTWLHADPVVLTLSAQGLQLRCSPPWTTEQLHRVTALVSEHLAAEGMTWRVAGNRSFIHVSDILNAHTESVLAASHMPLSDAMPSGADAKRLRQTMNDVQMLIHDKLDATAPNGMWLWGAGPLPDAAARSLPAMWTDDDFARGVYRLHGADDRCFGLPGALDDVLGGANDASPVILARDKPLAELEAAWFAPAQRALDAGRVREVSVNLDGWTIRAHGSFLRRFFARPRALHEVLK